MPSTLRDIQVLRTVLGRLDAERTPNVDQPKAAWHEHSTKTAAEISANVSASR